MRWFPLDLTNHSPARVTVSRKILQFHLLTPSPTCVHASSQEWWCWDILPLIPNKWIHIYFSLSLSPLYYVLFGSINSCDGTTIAYSIRSNAIIIWVKGWQLFFFCKRADRTYFQLWGQRSLSLSYNLNNSEMVAQKQPWFVNKCVP